MSEEIKRLQSEEPALTSTSFRTSHRGRSPARPRHPQRPYPLELRVRMIFNRSVMNCMVTACTVDDWHRRRLALLEGMPVMLIGQHKKKEGPRYQGARAAAIYGLPKPEGSQGAAAYSHGGALCISVVR